MPKILLPDFSTKDYSGIVDSFLFMDKTVSLPAGSLAPLREHLVKWDKQFRKVFQSYFEGKGSARYDNLTQKMEDFTNQILEYGSKLHGQEKKSFFLFWNEVADIIESDTIQSQDNYLKNSCNYFIWELTKLSKQSL
ncbi:MAG TPA: hypothetical protein VK809_00405 [Bacteroidia bacterium]|jgi:hypothetical protein|nr:hypothetical protein [Bacteroidia bacterium]